EGGGIEDDDVKTVLRTLKLTQIVEGVGYGEPGPLRKPVQLGIATRGLDRSLGAIDAEYLLGPVMDVVQGKSAVVTENVKNSGARNERRKAPAVLFLVQEVARLLPRDDVDLERQSVLLDDHGLGGQFAPEQPRAQVKSLVAPARHVA